MSSFDLLRRPVALLLLLCFCLTSLGWSAASQSAPPAAATTASGTPITPQYLDQLLAPVALYPDVLLIQILSASTTPQEVLDGGNWLLQNQKLKGTELTDAAKKAGFGPAMLALVQFPTIVDMMCRETDWTKQLGEAFTADQKAVLDSAQRLRKQAQAAGNLKTTKEQTVVTKQENGQTIIIVQPANPQVVYVPQYNPQVVYVQSAPSSPSSGALLLTFVAGIALGAAINNNDYYYPHWGYGAVYYGARPFYPHVYVYHPVYTSHYRPAAYYRPPANYRYNYNHYGNTNVNVHNNYYNQFNKNANINNVNRPKTMPAQNQSWKGQKTYGGATGNANAANRANIQQSQTRSANRGYGGQSNAATVKHTAFSSGSAKQERAASSRGRASSGGGSRSSARSASGGRTRRR
jgi:hypothetical protein